MFAGLLSDLMMCIARHMSLREFIEVLFGRTEILSRLRSHLQQFVRTNVLRGKDPTDSNIHAAVTEMTNSIIDELRIVKVRHIFLLYFFVICIKFLCFRATLK